MFVVGIDVGGTFMSEGAEVEIRAVHSGVLA